MKVLFIYPKISKTFWSFSYALKFVSKKAAYPPLGLLTVASMLPEDWEKKLIDLNVEKLKEKDLKDVDMVFISGMQIQKDSAKEVINFCKKKGLKIVAGGPLFMVSREEFEDVDHFILGEAENIISLFLDDLKSGNLKKVYSSDDFANLQNSPAPAWDLIKFKKYGSLSIQYSRGCPYNCDFCNVTTLFGHKIRTKTKDQIIFELERLFENGWRGEVFFVDDNFIGNKRKLKEEILPSIISWMKERDYPFTFNTQSSINLADDEELINLMVKAGFNSVFIGIESPEEESLLECHKFQNKGRDLISSIKKLQRSGLEVAGGFIVGFDNDKPSIFEEMTRFIQKSGIVTAMVGLLNAPKGTKLYKKLLGEKRLTNEITGDNTDFSLNFIPKMKIENLLSGYKKIIKEIYSPKPYFERVKKLLKEYKPFKKPHIRLSYLKAFLKSIFILGIKDRARFYYWKIFFWSLFRKPKLFPMAITYAIYGYHFRNVFKNYLND